LSIHATSWAFKVQNILPSQKLVLIALADAHNGHTGECFPSINRIMQMTMLSERSVQRATVELEAAGLIRKEIVPDDRGRTRGVRYHLGCGGEGATVAPRPARVTGGRVPQCQPLIKNNLKEGTGTFKSLARKKALPKTSVVLDGDDEAWPFGDDGETLQ
jgi:hypothetical protein